MNWKKLVRRARVPLGALFSVVFLLVARPTWLSLGLSVPLVLLGVGVRAWAAGTLRKKEALATTGPYAHTRNPLYLGSGLMALGFAVASDLWPLAVLLAVLFYAVYRPTILHEERFLRGRYEGFDEYVAAVPRIVPRLTPARVGDGERGVFSREVYLNNREYQALLGVAAVYGALIVRLLFWKAH